MDFCPIRGSARKFPKEIALITDAGSFSYETLDRMIDNYPVGQSIFYAYPNIETILQIFAPLRKGLPCMPISPKAPQLPQFELPKEPLFCLQTSGSTGKPKTALIKLEQFQCMVQNVPFLLNPRDHYLIDTPLNHAAALFGFIKCMFAGSTAVLTPKNDQITHLFYTPTQLKRYFKNPSYPKLHTVLTGGAPMPLTLATDLYHRNLKLYLGYGLTELVSVAMREFSPCDGILYGHALPHRKLAVAPDGEILIGGKVLFSGYLGMEEPGSWFPTKDLGTLTDEGLRIIGRKDRMRISGGENIYPEEIEVVISSIPEVDSFFVSFREDEEYGHRPVAYIQFTKEIPFEAVREQLLTALPSYKTPYLTDLHPLSALQKDSDIPGARAFLERTFSK